MRNFNFYSVHHVHAEGCSCPKPTQDSPRVVAAETAKDAIEKAKPGFFGDQDSFIEADCVQVQSPVRFPKVGMAINRGSDNVKAALAKHLEAAADFSLAVGLWFNGLPAHPTLAQLAKQIREFIEPTICLCGAPEKNGVCSVPDCVASQAKEDTLVLTFTSLSLRDRFFEKRFKGREICEQAGLYQWGGGSLGVHQRTVSVYGTEAINRLLADLIGAEVKRG